MNALLLIHGKFGYELIHMCLCVKTAERLLKLAPFGTCLNFMSIMHSCLQDFTLFSSALVYCSLSSIECVGHLNSAVKNRPIDYYQFGRDPQRHRIFYICVTLLEFVAIMKHFKNICLFECLLSNCL